MKKEVVGGKIEKHLKDLLDELNLELSSKLDGSVMQCSDVNDIDSHAHQFQVIKEELSVKKRITELQIEKDHLNKFPEGELNRVGNGALIKLKGQFLYIGVSIPTIEIQGNKVTGISKHSPIYQKIKNKTQGFKFKFNDVICEIESIQ